MKKIRLVALCFFLIFFTGCWNYNEINELAIVNAMGIDEDTNGYKITLVIGNGESTSSSTKEGDSISSLLVGKGKTITDAVEDIKKKTSKSLYLSHISMILISDKVAFKSVYPVIDSVFRNPETIKKYQIVIAKEKPAFEFLKVMSPFEPSTSNNISTNIIEDKNNSGYNPDIILSDFLFRAVNDGWDPYMSSIILKGDPDKANDIKDLEKTYVPTYIKLGGVALFRNYKLVGFANESESKGLNIINNEVNSLIITNKCFKNKDKFIVVKLDSVKSKMKVDIKDGVKVKFTVTTGGSINETDCKIELNKNEVISKINKITEKNVKSIITKGIEKSIELNSDILGIGFQVSKIKSDYKFKLKDITYDIDVKVNIKTKGSLENTIKELDDEKED